MSDIEKAYQEAVELLDIKDQEINRLKLANALYRWQPKEPQPDAPPKKKRGRPTANNKLEKKKHGRPKKWDEQLLSKLPLAIEKIKIEKGSRTDKEAVEWLLKPYKLKEDLGKEVNKVCVQLSKARKLFKRVNY